MNSARASLIAAVGLVFSAEVVSAQDSFRYWTYVLESSLESVVAAVRLPPDRKNLLITTPRLDWRLTQA